MSEDYRQRWVRALRRDDFKQGREYLATVKEGITTHCCLGVAAEIFYEEMDVPRKVSRTGIVHFGGRTAYLPSLIAEALHLTHEHQTQLTMMNDNGVPWDTIAVWIEENVPETNTSEEVEEYHHIQADSSDD